MRVVRLRMNGLLLRGVLRGSAKRTGMWRPLYDHRSWPWTFVEAECVRADEQRDRAGIAAGGDLTEAVIRGAERVRQPVRGDDPDGGADLRTPVPPSDPSLRR